jgi:RNA polymerase sigma factor (sigma-70 family)
MNEKVKNKDLHVEQTYKEQKGKLLGFIRKSLPLEQAEDIMQDVFMQFYSAWDQIKSLESTSSWLYRTATHKIIDSKRKKKPDLFGDKVAPGNSDSEGELLYLEDILPSLSDDPENELFRQVIWDGILEALDELPKEQKDVFVQHEFEDLSFERISVITGEKVNTLISRKRYAVLFLRERLNEIYNVLND